MAFPPAPPPPPTSVQYLQDKVLDHLTCVQKVTGLTLIGGQTSASWVSFFYK